jgi:type I restriction enzyme M protein
LPGGVFSSAGAGVKTNLVFFTKDKPTERIWYYDLSGVKVGKKTPLTLAHFDEFSKLLPKRADSPSSWTVDHTARVEKAREDARPHREKAAELDAQAKDLVNKVRDKKRANNGNGRKPDPELDALEEKLKAVERQSREATAKADDIEAAAYDLTAVNPNRKSEEDTRTPAELLDFIAAKGQEADAALARLRSLISP